MIVFPILVLFIGAGFIFSTVHFREKLGDEHVSGLCIIGTVFSIASCILFGVLIK